MQGAVISPLAGREPERARIAAFAEALADGARTLLIRGEPGIGKTALWRLAAADCARAGCRVLDCRPAEEELSLGLSGLVDLFEDTDARRGRAPAGGQRARARPRGAARAAVARAGGAGRAGRRRPAVARRRLCPGAAVRAAAAGRRARRGAGHAARRRGRPAGRRRAPPARALRGARPRAARARGAPARARRDVRGDLTPVAASDPRDLRRQPAVRHRARARARATADPRSAGLAAGRARLAPGQRAVRARPACSRRSPRSAPPPSHELRALLAGEDVDALLDEAEALELLVVGEDLRVRFSHPLIGSAVYGRMRPRKRQALHARLAAGSGDPDVRARHLALSTDVPDARRGRAARRGRRPRAPARGVRAGRRLRRPRAPAHPARRRGRRAAAGARRDPGPRRRGRGPPGAGAGRRARGADAARAGALRGAARARLAGGRHLRHERRAPAPGAGRRRRRRVAAGPGARTTSAGRSPSRGSTWPRASWPCARRSR